MKGLPLPEERLLEDTPLALAAAQGDPDAFRALVERYRGYIYTIAHKIVLHEDDALDVTQTVFLRLCEKLGQFDGRGSFRGWLATLTAREAINHQRRPARRESPTDPEAVDHLVETNSGGEPPGSDPRHSVLLRERRDLVEQAMTGLSHQQRAIFTLRFREELGPREIAERLGIPDQQVRSQLHRAIVAIRGHLAKKGCLE